MEVKLSWNEVQATVPLIVSCAAALTSLSHGVSYVTFLFSKWRIATSIKSVDIVQSEHSPADDTRCLLCDFPEAIVFLPLTLNSDLLVF